MPFVYIYLREGTSQAEMLAFPSDAAREREKFAKRISHRYEKTDFSG